MSELNAAELAAQLIGLSPPNHTDTITEADVGRLQTILAWADVYIYLEDKPGRYYLLARHEPLRIRMFKEARHPRAHIHIDYGRDLHIASYAVDTGERLAGNLERRYDKATSIWIEQNRRGLIKIWDALQSDIDPEKIVGDLDGAHWPE